MHRVSRPSLLTQNDERKKKLDMGVSSQNIILGMCKALGVYWNFIGGSQVFSYAQWKPTFSKIKPTVSVTKPFKVYFTQDLMKEICTFD